MFTVKVKNENNVWKFYNVNLGTICNRKSQGSIHSVRELDAVEKQMRATGLVYEIVITK